MPGPPTGVGGEKAHLAVVADGVASAVVFVVGGDVSDGFVEADGVVGAPG